MYEKFFYVLRSFKKAVKGGELRFFWSFPDVWQQTKTGKHPV
jgi:hypothetical protein